MNSETRQDELAIRQLHETFEQATAAKDLDRIMAQYADDVVAFDAVGALQFKGVPSIARTGSAVSSSARAKAFSKPTSCTWTSVATWPAAACSLTVAAPMPKARCRPPGCAARGSGRAAMVSGR